MASKLKTDILETVSGSGTIALTNQLSGMTGASMPSGSVIQVVGTKSGATFTSTSTSYVELPHLRCSITTLSANSKILVTMNVSKQANQSNETVVATEIRSSLDNYSAALLTNTTAFYPTWIQTQGNHIVLHTAGQAAGTTITYRMYGKVNQGTLYAPDLWGIGGFQSSTVIQEIKG